ncbi:histidine kinase dimerization/phospho-acceptor domain-containing protein [Phormidesmis sp. 146-12]
MGIPESRLFCRLDGLTAAARRQRQIEVLTRLGLLETESVPIFEEATQTAAHFLEVPICILSLLDQERQWFKSAVGLSRLGLMNDLARARQLPLAESFCVHVVDSHQVLAIADTLRHPAFASSLLVQQYNIRAYLGAPLLTSSGECIGALALMDLLPRSFTPKEIEFLALTARLSMSEYERLHLTKTQETIAASQPSADALPLTPETLQPRTFTSLSEPPTPSPHAHPVKFALLAQLTQELRTPLTSVMGMASVLNREIYGPLTAKQKEYLDIIHHSGQYLLSLVKEILELSQLDESTRILNLTSIDIEMLCQQAIDTLEQAAHRREQAIRLSVEPGNRIWLLDKEKVRQMLYHLIFSVIQSSNGGSVIRLHVSHKSSGLKLTVWATHPCLGDGLAYTEIYPAQTASPALVGLDYDYTAQPTYSQRPLTNGNGKHSFLLDEPDVVTDLNAEALRKNLGLMLSRQLAEMHGGQVLVQGVGEPGFRYLITLPRLTEIDEKF